MLKNYLTLTQFPCLSELLSDKYFSGYGNCAFDKEYSHHLDLYLGSGQNRNVAKILNILINYRSK